MFRPAFLPILVFLTMLFLPSVQGVTHLLPERELGENRTLAAFPPLALLTQPEPLRIDQYTERLSNWHSDRFPTRDLWVRLRTQYVFTLFGESDQVYVGRDGYLFYHSVIDTEVPIVERMSSEDVAAFADEVGRLSAQLESRGMHLIVLPLRLKHAYYPEMLPRAAAHARDFHRMDEIIDALARQEGVDLIDSRPILRQAKAEGLQVFHRTDFHWTDPAGALVLRELLTRVGAREGLDGMAGEMRYEVRRVRSSGGQARFLPLFAPPSETTIELAMQAPDREIGLRESSTYETLYDTVWPPERLAPPIVVYGDSFFDAMERARVGQHFRTYARARLGHQSLSDAYAARPEGARYLVLEFIEVAPLGVREEVRTLLQRLEAGE